MGLELKNVWNVEDEFKDVITAVVDAVAGESAPRRLFGDLVHKAQSVAVAYRSGHAVHKGNYWCVDKDADEVITALVKTVVGESAHGGLYDEAVYDAAQNLPEVFKRFFVEEFKTRAEAIASLPFADTLGEFVERRAAS
jgi:hypothetical protein